MTEEHYKLLETVNNKMLDEEKINIKQKLQSSFADIGNMANMFLDNQPIYYDTNGIFWFWNNNNKLWKMVDETTILNSIDDILQLSGTFSPQMKNTIMEAIRRQSRRRRPKDIPNYWIQFKSNIINLRPNEKPDDLFPELESGRYFIDPKYWKYENIIPNPELFLTNPIPWELGDSDKTPTIDKMFKEWVGEKYVKTLYQIISYCMLPDYPLHRIFCLMGAGLNGKGTFLNLITRVIGKDNCCATELDSLLTSRFEATRLYKKLVAQMGETNFTGMKKTSMLKKLSGGDLINFEFKNKNPFDDYNFAKLIISTNSLPITEDRTDGFYRRWMLIDFPNRFSEKKDILSTIPKEEYSNLCFKCVNLLKELLEVREFENEGTIEDRKKRYEERSNPIDLFIKTYLQDDPNSCISYRDLYGEYIVFLRNNGYREINKREFSSLMREEGYEIKQKRWGEDSIKDTWVESVFFKYRPSVHNVHNGNLVSTQSLYKETKCKVNGHVDIVDRVEEIKIEDDI